jgi:hypothetical protein
VNRYVAELRSEISGDKLRGHAAVFGQYADLGNELETLAPEAFDAVLAGDPDVRALVNHDPTLLLARTRNGSLKLGTDEVGLTFEATVPDTSYGRDLRTLIDQGLLTQCSFGFQPGKDKVTRTEDGRRLRTHTSIADLFDVSPVTFPAYEGTDVALRSMTFATSPAVDRPTQLILARHRALNRAREVH